MADAALRIIDANANRAREALRVLEDVARFGLNDASIAATLKQLRHDLAAALASLPVSGVELLAARHTPGDVGTSISTQSEMRRAGLPDVATAAAKRLQEALRSMEEAAKTLAPSEAPRRLEALRYRAYDAEQRLVLALARPAPFLGFRLCVLITESLCTRHPWLEVARLAIEGGADCLQLREKGLETGELVERARALVELAAQWNSRPAPQPRRRVRVIINDRPDVAIEAGADGVHLGQDDMPCAEARRLLDATGGKFLLGVSTSRIEEAVQAQSDGADYCGAGPMFPSTTKQKDRLAGPEYLAEYLRRDPPLPPVVAISGIHHENFIELESAADLHPFGVAVSSVVCSAKDPADSAAAFVELLREYDWTSEYVDSPDSFQLPKGAHIPSLSRFTPVIRCLLEHAIVRGDVYTASELARVGHLCWLRDEDDPPDREPMSNWTFDQLVGLLSDERVLTTSVSNGVLWHFHLSWGGLTAEHRRRLLATIEAVFARMQSSDAWFTTSVVLGEQYCNEAALEACERLAALENAPGRVFIPHAFEHIAKDSGDADLASRAIDRIRAMLDDPDKHTRCEARVSLMRLGLPPDGVATEGRSS